MRPELPLCILSTQFSSTCCCCLHGTFNIFNFLDKLVFYLYYCWYFDYPQRCEQKRRCISELCWLGGEIKFVIFSRQDTRHTPDFLTLSLKTN